jgi:hypothetical protein
MTCKNITQSTSHTIDDWSKSSNHVGNWNAQSHAHIAIVLTMLLYDRIDSVDRYMITARGFTLENLRTDNSMWEAWRRRLEVDAACFELLWKECSELYGLHQCMTNRNSELFAKMCDSTRTLSNVSFSRFIAESPCFIMCARKLSDMTVRDSHSYSLLKIKVEVTLGVQRH